MHLAMAPEQTHRDHPRPNIGAPGLPGEHGGSQTDPSGTDPPDPQVRQIPFCSKDTDSEPGTRSRGHSNLGFTAPVPESVTMCRGAAQPTGSWRLSWLPWRVGGIPLPHFCSVLTAAPDPPYLMLFPLSTLRRGESMWFRIRILYFSFHF